MKLISYVTIVIIIWIEILVSSSTGNYYRGLVKYLRRKSKLHQVMFILDDEINNTTKTIHSVMRTVNRNFPSFSISINERRSKLNANYLKSLERPKKTTLFIVEMSEMNSKKNHQIIDVMYLIKRLTLQSSQPKVLIVREHELYFQNYDQFLKFLWKNDFLDITILTHDQPQTVLLEKKRDKRPDLYMMNPFAKKYSAGPVSSKSLWFPNKLQNLHGYPLSIIVDSGFQYLKKLGRFGKFLEQGMNFKLNILEIIETDLSIEWKTKMLIQEEAELWLNPLFYIGKLNQHLMKMSTYVHNDLKAVVPEIESTSKIIVISQEFLYMLFGTIGMICLLKLTAIIMRFKKNIWQTFNMSQIVMGMSVVQEPVTLAEKTVFGSLVIACIVYTGYLYSVILDLSLQISTSRIETLAELAASSLTPVTTVDGAIAIMSKSSIPHIRKLSQKAIQEKSKWNCLRHLNDYQNVTCITTVAQSFVNHYIKIKGQFKGRVLKESVLSYDTFFLSRPYSPYTDRFQEIIRRATESGILKGLTHQEEEKHHIITRPEQIEKEKLLLISLYILSIGFTLSIITFLIEIVAKKFGPKISAFIKRQF